MNAKNISFIENFHIPRWNELPSVDLYLDQVVTFVNSTLSTPIEPCSPKIEDEVQKDIKSDKTSQILTKTMINNYVKNNLIEAPVKKKYSKIQLAKLFVICILKQVYSMSDIHKLMLIALEKTSLESAYNSFCEQFEEALKCIFSRKEFALIEVTDDNKYLLKSVLLSCSYKIYSRNVIVSKYEDE